MAVIRQRPIATVRNDGWVIGGAETPHEAVDEDPFDVADGLVSQINAISSGNLIVLFKFEPPPLFDTLNAATFVYEARQEASGSGYNGYVLSSSSNAVDSIQTPLTFTERQWTQNTDPATASTWTREGLVNAAWGVEAQGDAGPAVQKTLTRVYLLLDIVKSPAQIEQERNAASALLRMLHRPPRQLGVDVPPRFLDLLPLDGCDVAHFAGPTADGLGWGVDSSVRRRFIFLGSEVDLRSFKTKVELWDPRNFIASLWYVFLGARESSPTQDGIPKLLAGGTENFVRDNDGALCFDPSSRKLTYRREDEPLDDLEGRLMSDTATNKVRNSVFEEGIDVSWTTNGGANGGSATAETVDIKAEPDVSTIALRLQAGSPLGGIDKTQTTTSTYAASSVVTASFLHKDPGGTGSEARVSIQNTTTTNWLQTNLTWGASEADIDLSLSETDYGESHITFTMEGTTSTLLVRLKTNKVASQVNLWQAVTIVEYQNFVGWIKTSSTADTTKGFDSLIFSNNDGTRVWEHGHGTGFLHFSLLWGDTVTGARTGIIALSGSDISGQVFWAPSTDSFIFRRTISATTYDASISGVTLSAGDDVRIAFRWTDVAREDLDALTHDIWLSINGAAWVQGGPTTHVAVPAAATANAVLGASDSSGSDHFNAFWKRVMVTPQVYRIEELKRLPLL